MPVLLAGVSHDIGNAVLPVVGMAELLGREAEPGTETRRKLDLLIEATLRTFNLCQKLTCFALREGSGRMVVELGWLLRDAQRWLEGDGVSSRLIVEACEEPVLVMGNPLQLLRLVTLLLESAWESLPPPCGEEAALAVKDARPCVRLGLSIDRTARPPLALLTVAAHAAICHGSDGSPRRPAGRSDPPRLLACRELAREQGGGLDVLGAAGVDVAGAHRDGYVVRLPLVGTLAPGESPAELASCPVPRAERFERGEAPAAS